MTPGKSFLIAVLLAAITAPTHCKKEDLTAETTLTLEHMSSELVASNLPEPIIEDKKIEQEVKKPHDATRLSKRDRRLRKRKSKTTRHTISTMTYDELREAKNRKIQEKNIEIAIKYLEKMLPECKDMHEQKDLIIELGDLLFQHGDLEKAGKRYNEFAKLYPAHEKTEHAEYRAILCSFYTMLDAWRDQTKTRETLELTQKFLERVDVFTEYASEVASIQKKCFARLVDSEIGILEFYLNRNSLRAAQTRIDGLRKDFTQAMADLEPRLLSYEIQVAQKQHNTELVEQKQLELQEKFPLFGQVSAVLASADTKKTDFSQKF